jgi:hypothetical protein
MPKNATAEAVMSTAKATPAPYLPFRTFQTAYEALEHGIPKRLDRTIWPSQSGIVQSQILMSFRFLGLVDDQDCPTELLQQLVEDKEKRAGIITKILNISYRALLDHDLTKMTPKMVEDEMERYSVTGETKRKAVTFFLRAAKFAGEPMHPLLSSMVRNTGTRKRRSKSVVIPEMTGAADPAYNPDEKATTTQTTGLSNGGRIVLQVFGDPFTLASEERQFVFDLVDKLRARPSVDQAGDEYADEEDESA